MSSREVYRFHPEDQYLDMFDSESDISGDNSEDELVEVL